MRKKESVWPWKLAGARELSCDTIPLSYYIDPLPHNNMQIKINLDCVLITDL